MFDIGWTELMLIAIVALIVIGPKDLPGMFHTMGRVMARLRSMGREFSRAMEDAARESGVNDISKDLRNVANPRKMGLDAVKDAASKFENWDPLKATKTATKPVVKSAGPHTQQLAADRAEAARKIQEATAQKAQARIDAEKAATTSDDAGAAAPPVTPPASPKPAARKPAVKKTAAAKPAAPKKAATAAAPKAATAKTATKKPAVKKPAAKKTTAKKAPARKSDE